MRFFLALVLIAIGFPALADCGALGSRETSLANARAVAAEIGQPVVTIDDARLAQAASDTIHDLAGAPRVPAAALIILSGVKGLSVISLVDPAGCVQQMIVLPTTVLNQTIGEGI